MNAQTPLPVRQPARPDAAEGREASDAAAWAFVLAAYGGTGVSASCIALQDFAGVDVVLLLAAGYGARLGVGLDDTMLAALGEVVADWRSSVVAPLRAVRRAMKQLDLPGLQPEIQAARRALQETELATERLEFTALTRLIAREPRSGEVAVAPQLGLVVGRTADPSEVAIARAIGFIAQAMERVPL